MPTATLFSRNKTYCFVNNSYIRISRGESGPGRVDPGYPKDISVWRWPENFAPNGIDAALHSRGKTYFFAGNQYIRVSRGDAGPGRVDEGYPRNISVWGWPSQFALNGNSSFNVPGIDAALFSGNKTYFFAGNQYIRVSRGESGPGRVDPGYPKDISVWGWPANYAPNGINAALHSRGKTYFFAGNQYIRVSRGDSGPGRVDEGYPKNISVWGWPSEFEEDWAAIASNFSFNDNISEQQHLRLLERYRAAFNSIQNCNSLTSEEKDRLTQTFRRPIRNGLDTRGNVNASAFLNGNQIFINFSNLFPAGNNEISQTLIHELMHCAGYTHPTTRRVMPGICPDPRRDCPGDNGQYYGTPPLRSEICIAGNQSDVNCVDDGSGMCVMNSFND